jgi:hypothetical protein
MNNLPRIEGTISIFKQTSFQARLSSCFGAFLTHADEG